MTEKTTTVEIDGEEREVVHDTEEDEWFIREPLSELKKCASDVTPLTDSNVVGTADVNWDKYYEHAERTDGVGRMYVTPKYLREFAEVLEDEHNGFGGVTIHVSKDLPLVATLSDGTELLMAPRVKYSRD